MTPPKHAQSCEAAAAREEKFHLAGGSLHDRDLRRIGRSWRGAN